MRGGGALKRLLAFLLLLAGAAHAAPTATLLDEGVGGRAMAMGGAGAAIVEDATALYWNPARLGLLKKREAAGAHAELTSARVVFAGWTQPEADGGAGLGLVYRDAPGRPNKDLETSDAVFTLAYAKKEADDGNAGAAFKYVRSRVPGQDAHTVAVDMGISRGEEGRTTALVVRNMGPRLNYGSLHKDLPLTIVAGLGYDKATISAGLDYEYRPRTGAHDVGAGLEWELFAGLFARGGWTTKDERAPGLVVSRGFTVGGGAQLGGLRLDYAFRPKAGRYHRADVAFRF